MDHSTTGEHESSRIAELEAEIEALREERSDLLDRLAVIRSTATLPSAA